MRRSTTVVAMALALGGCASIVRHRIYQPTATTTVPAWRERAPITIEVTTSDGVTLRGLYWAPQPPPRDLLIYFHGNGGHLYRDAARAEPLASGGRGVLLTSYRGFSGNPGHPTERGLRRDAAAFTDWARAQLPPGGRLFLFGHSLGAAVALGEAARRPVDGVATLGAFTTIGEFAPAIARPFMPDRFDNRRAIAQVAAPVFLFHGTADEVVPYADAARLKAASGGRAQVVTIRDGTHHPDPVALAPEIWRALEAGARPRP